VIPSGCGIGRAPDGSFKVTGRLADVTGWWFREMQGRAVGAGLVVSQAGVSDEGVWYSDGTGFPCLRTWAQVHRDLGDSFLRASRADSHPGPDVMDHRKFDQDHPE